MKYLDYNFSVKDQKIVPIEFLYVPHQSPLPNGKQIVGNVDRKLNANNKYLRLYYFFNFSCG